MCLGCRPGLLQWATETKLKLYVEARHDEELDKAKAKALLDKMTVLKHFMQNCRWTCNL